MKALLFLLTALPGWVCAQPDTLRPIRPQDLKPIESELIPTYGGRYGTAVRSQYTYDGLDIKAKNLAPYILASGDPTAIREINAYIKSRQAGGFMIAGGIIAMITGSAIAFSNMPGPDGRYTMQQPIVCPTGYVCGGSLGTGYGGQVVGYQTVTDTKRQNAAGWGGATLLLGAVMTGIGWGMNIPGHHVRRAVQYYNRALKQQGISWQMQPYSSLSNSGIGLVGKF